MVEGVAVRTPEGHYDLDPLILQDLGFLKLPTCCVSGLADWIALIRHCPVALEV